MLARRRNAGRVRAAREAEELGHADETIADSMYMDNPASGGDDADAYYSGIEGMRLKKVMLDAVETARGRQDGFEGMLARERAKVAVRKAMKKELEGLKPRNPLKEGTIDDPLFITWLRGKEQLLNNPMLTPWGYEILPGHSGFKEVRDLEERKVVTEEMRAYLFDLHMNGPQNETEVRTQWTFLIKPIQYALEVLETHWSGAIGTVWADKKPTLYDLFGSTTGELIRDPRRMVLGGKRHDKATEPNAKPPWPRALTWSGLGPALVVPDDVGGAARIPLPLCQEVNPFMREFYIYSSYRHWLDEFGKAKGIGGVGWYIWSLSGNRIEGATRRIEMQPGAGRMLSEDGGFPMDDALATVLREGEPREEYPGGVPERAVGQLRQQPEIGAQAHIADFEGGAVGGDADDNDRELDEEDDGKVGDDDSMKHTLNQLARAIEAMNRYLSEERAPPDADKKIKYDTTKEEVPPSPRLPDAPLVIEDDDMSSEPLPSVSDDKADKKAEDGDDKAEDGEKKELDEPLDEGAVMLQADKASRKALAKAASFLQSAAAALLTETEDQKEARLEREEKRAAELAESRAEQAKADAILNALEQQ